MVDGYPNITDWVENIFFPIDGSAPAGTYIYFDHNFAQEGTAPDPWELQVLLLDEVVASHTGLLADDMYSRNFTFVKA